MNDHRWQGYTHAELYELLHQGPGPSASGDPSRRWRELERTFREIDDGMAAALNAVAADWQGEAAESVRRGLRPLREWVEDVSGAAGRMRQCSEQQADFVARARAEMPPPVRVTAEEPNGVTSALVHLFGGQTDYEVQEQRQHAAEQRAFDVMRRYQESSEANATALASFEAPPQVVVDAPSRAVAGGSGGDVTISWHRPPDGATTGRSWGAASSPGRATGSSSQATRGRAGTGRSTAPTPTPRAAVPRRVPRTEPEEEREVAVEATETEGGTSPFDEYRVSARPVIGGDPS
ncbi:hypothetical protein CDG81_03795 [Actinopolyspora erythraea]|uniref:PPE domain-containing protein n=1 Tax=Actinopolyspora erythraea TaxID=414996 RepID=A0A099D3N8_9ACTN|nr:PPE domain-containing protein [Actinopolyspora erythraea]ASU77577.1 hypothetical protein CDG81_03795 [Actinopolyspora erythraea]KGI80427.1 hypothetical protein IL38_17160 [Actinopolyspora erythraea]